MLRKLRIDKKAFSLLEVMMVIGMLSVIFYLFWQVVEGTAQANFYAGAFNELARSSQDVINNVKEDGDTSKRLFQKDTFGLSYYNKISFPATYTPISTITLPVIDVDGLFEKDTLLNQKTGNCLFFAKTLPAFSCTVATGVTRTVDLIQFVCYYLKKIQGVPISNASNSLTLVRWTSDIYADYDQILSISDANQRKAMVTALFNKKQKEIVRDITNNRCITYAWKSSQQATAAFYALYADGSIAAGPNNAIVFNCATCEPVTKNLQFKQSSVSWNTVDDYQGSATGSNFESQIHVPKFAIASQTGDGFPNGVEVQIIGPSGARQVFMRLVMLKQIPNRRIASYEVSVNISTKDY